MFKTYKNQLIEIIRDQGFDASLFQLNDLGSKTDINYRSSPFTFTFDLNGLDTYDIYATAFAHGYPNIGIARQSGIADSFILFKNWLKGPLKKFITEEATPDLWELLSSELPIVGTDMFDDPEYGKFSPDEKQQLLLSIAQFKLLINTTFNPTQEQLLLITQRLDYLAEAADRLPKFDWRSLLLTTTFSIMTTLTLSPEQGKVLFALLKQAFSYILTLPIPGL